jgi:hypothetical protein
VCHGEAECLKLGEGKATREDGLLSIRTADGKMVSFRNSPPDCQPNDEEEPAVECPRYELAGYVPSRSIWVINDVGSGGATIISAGTGGTLKEAAGTATLSPAGALLLILMSNLEGFAYSIDVEEVGASSLKRAFSFDSTEDASNGPIERGAALVGWQGEDTIELTIEVSSDSDDDRERTAHVIHASDGWHLERPWRDPPR